MSLFFQKGTIVKQKNMEAGPGEFLSIIEPYREDAVVGYVPIISFNPSTI